MMALPPAAPRAGAARRLARAGVAGTRQAAAARSGADTRSRRSLIVRSADQDEPGAPAPRAPPAADEDEDLWIERELRRRQKKRQQQGPKVVAPAVEKAKGAAVPTATDAAETLALRFLALFFGVILVEGVLLAASGFLPDEADAFIERTLYKTFSPTVGVFLTCSSVYGLWKSRQGEGQ